jgi:hypothetical protein
MNQSVVSNMKQYYFTNILDRPSKLTCKTVYDFYHNGMLINKEKQYGIIWFPKCACSTISKIFCDVNKIHIEPDKVRFLNMIVPDYRHNVYLQNISFITFVRNPYYRYIATYIDKHVYKNDPKYIDADIDFILESMDIDYISIEYIFNE